MPLNHQVDTSQNECDWIVQEAQLMLTNPRDAFSGQSRSPNMVQFDTLDMFLVYNSILVPKTHRFWDTRLVSIQWPWNKGYGLLMVIGTDT